MKLEEQLRILQPNIKLVTKIDSIISNCKNFNLNDTILVAGTPRSGTTWMMEILGGIKNYTYLFEPLHSNWFPETRKIGFESRSYLPINTDWYEGKDYLYKVFTGKVVSDLPLYVLKPKMVLQRLFCNKLIVKAVRMNRMLPWVSKNFKLKNMILIIRHPCAVIASQLKTGFFGYWSITPPYVNICPNRNMVLQEASKIDILDEKNIKNLKKIETVEEVLAAVWCLDYYVPLSLKKPHPWTTVFYELLKKEGEKEIPRIFKEIGEINIKKSTYNKINNPSILAMRDDLKVVKDTDKQLSKWKENLSKKQIEKILKVVSDFGLDFYTEDIEPDYKVFNSFCNSK